jgi:NADH-quinone oxidoreductase subunit E
MPSLEQIETMNQDLIRMMPKEMASAVNLFAHPVAGAAAMSALGIGLANHAFGVWMGALSGAAEASQRMLLPIVDGFEARAERVSETARNASKARAATRTLIAEAQSFARDVTDMAAVDSTPAADTERATANPAGAGQEDLRQPRIMDRPEKPSDLKAIPGIGPKLEKVLNGLGIWTYAQIAAWTPDEIAWVEDYLSLTGRVGRDDWTARAAALAARK